MKIVISARDNQYGVSKIVISEIKRLIKKKNISKIFYIGPVLNIKHNKLRQINFKIIGKYYITKELFYAFQARKFINQVVASENIDLIYLHNSIFSKNWGIKTIFKCHGLHVQMLKRPHINFSEIINYLFHNLYSKIFEKRTIKFSNNTYFVSKETLKTANKYYPLFKNKYIYWPNYFENYSHSCTDDKFSSGTKTKKLLYIGRLEPHKGILDLITVFNKISKENDNIYLTIIGQGPLYNKIFEQKNAKIKLIGYIENSKLQQYYKEATLFVLPSYSENSPATIIEAISNNCLVLAGNVGDQKYMLNEVELFTPGNNLELEKKINYLFSINKNEKDKLISYNNNNLTIIEKKYNNLFKKIFINHRKNNVTLISNM